ncbi:hypothetical protein [Luteibacter aegosomatissinici]|uniref:hypothetical protein n=1 Tax=Luteibacter aegosomatissinici TaxID=2911539 RepID=UPI001FF759DC|nr:hypothetical protein [Luteibacter aegosomatissinici]UPG94309.1 hypothetical protein L2Y97_21250 [Luteibacter aegosomatissinici]
MANLATVSGEKVLHISEAELAEGAKPDPLPIEKGRESSVDEQIDETDENEGSGDGADGDQEPTGKVKATAGATPRAVFHVNVSLDSSLDTEKLEKQLALLKRYGAI